MPSLTHAATHTAFLLLQADGFDAELGYDEIVFGDHDLDANNEYDQLLGDTPEQPAAAAVQPAAAAERPAAAAGQRRVSLDSRDAYGAVMAAADAGDIATPRSQEEAIAAAGPLHNVTNQDVAAAKADADGMREQLLLLPAMELLENADERAFALQVMEREFVQQPALLKDRPQDAHDEPAIARRIYRAVRYSVSKIRARQGSGGRTTSTARLRAAFLDTFILNSISEDAATFAIAVRDLAIAMKEYNTLKAAFARATNDKRKRARDARGNHADEEEDEAGYTTPSSLSGTELMSMLRSGQAVAEAINKAPTATATQMEQGTTARAKAQKSKRSKFSREPKGITPEDRVAEFPDAGLCAKVRLPRPPFNHALLSLPPILQSQSYTNHAAAC